MTARSIAGIDGRAGLLLCGLSLPAASRLRGQGRAGALTLGVPLLLGLAVGFERVEPLRLVPAWVYLSVGIFFVESLKGGGSLIFQLARWWVPEAPDFVAPYCRVVTALWGAFFLLVAALCAGLALAGSEKKPVANSL